MLMTHSIQLAALLSDIQNRLAHDWGSPSVAKMQVDLY